MLQKTQRPPPNADKHKSSRPPSVAGLVRSRSTGKAEARVSPTVVMRTGALVVDIGSGSSRVGFAGQPRPGSVIDTMVGYPKGRSKRKEPVMGAAASTEPDLNPVTLVRQGIIVDWEAAEDLLRYAFSRDLGVCPEEHAVLFSDPPLSPTTNREKIAEFMFERFNVPAMHVSHQSVLSVYSYGKTSGLMVDSGDGVTQAVPVYDGYNLPDAISRVDLAGFDLTSYLIRLLGEAGNAFHERGRYIVDDIKQKCCYVAVDLGKESCQLDLVDYELPDGHIITIGKERFQCPEALFHPNLMDSNQEGVHIATLNSLTKVEAPLRQLMFDNVLLAGGSTLFEGFYSRFCREIFALVPKGTKANVLAGPERKHAAWIGGSILASLKAFQSMWIRREDYNDRGPAIVYLRCY